VQTRHRYSRPHLKSCRRLTWLLCPHGQLCLPKRKFMSISLKQEGEKIAWPKWHAYNSRRPLGAVTSEHICFFLLFVLELLGWAVQNDFFFLKMCVYTCTVYATEYTRTHTGKWSGLVPRRHEMARASSWAAKERPKKLQQGHKHTDIVCCDALLFAEADAVRARQLIHRCGLAVFFLSL
jgi:hypothetical protein